MELDLVKIVGGLDKDVMGKHDKEECRMFVVFYFINPTNHGNIYLSGEF